MLVIDDLHELRSVQAVAWLDLFPARLPSQLAVVLATREEPRVGLHRLRVAGELTELRASDLREIAFELFVSANMVRTHVRHIYAKFNVHNRGEAVTALGIHERALSALRTAPDGYASRAFHADGEAVVFALRCYVELEPEQEQAAYRLRPMEVQVLVTNDYLLTQHDERVSLPAVLAPDLPPDGARKTSSIRCSTQMLATTFDALDEVELRPDTLVAAWTEGDGGNAHERDAMGAGSGRHNDQRSVSAGRAEHVGAAGRRFVGEGAELIARLEDDRLAVPLTGRFGKPCASGPFAAGPRVHKEHRPLWRVGASPAVTVLSRHRSVHRVAPEAAIGTS
jgi:Bacterial regulatory proteins, luxR family